ncbi:MAG: ABC transporter ATP-binding protein [Chitinophagaceae bacterium]
MPAIIARNIVKFYGVNKDRIKALSGVSIEVSKGELFGLIGPDGAGKTSLIRILTTLLLADEGDGSVDGFDLVKNYKDIRRNVGYMPGKFSLYPDLTVEENLNFFATIFSTTIKENYDLIKDIYIQLEPFKSRRAGNLSGGMKQKLALCCALIHKPSVLFLDEPTTGVDAVSRKEFWEMLLRLKEQGITILVSTPYMDEAEMCDRVALMQSGKILSVDTPSGILKEFKNDVFEVRASKMLPLLKELQQYDGAVDAYFFGAAHHIVMKTKNNETDLKNYLSKFKPDDLEIHAIEPDIEDCFIALMKNVSE